MLEVDTVMRAFAEYTGWRPDGAKRVEDCGDVEVTELRYAKDLV